MCIKSVWMIRCQLTLERSPQDIGGINLFVLISLFSLIFCVPLALVMESHLWPAAVESAKASVGGAGLARMLVVRMRV